MACEFSMVRVGRIPCSQDKEQGFSRAFFRRSREFLRFAEEGGKGAEARR